MKRIRCSGQRCHRFIMTLFVLMVFLGSAALSPGYVLAGDVSECMMQMMNQVDGQTTIDELRSRCEQKIREEKFSETVQQPPVLTERLQQDRKQILEPFTLMAHKPNYFLAAAYNSNGYDPEPYRVQFDDPTLDADDTESQFQISIKTPLAIDLFNTFDIYAAYTNRSFWQVYNKEVSSPFRETNHEPEVWMQFSPNWEFLGFTNTLNSLGVIHQSNGRGGALSRSWNRVAALIAAERGPFALSFKPWVRIKEDYEDDDNPDITDYLGHYELRAGYKYKEHLFCFMTRNNLESNFEKGAVELSWSFPLWEFPYFKGYVQYFSGYGESLIDYNHYVNRIGIGIALTDWL